MSVTEIDTRSTTTADLIEVTSALRRALRRRVGRVEGASGLSDAQRELVRLVHRRPGIRVGEAASELYLAPNTVSTLVTSLCSLGWTYREADPRDGRSALLRLTPDAGRRVEEWRDRRLAVLSEAVTALSLEDQERIDAAVPALNRLVARLQEAE